MIARREATSLPQRVPGLVGERPLDAVQQVRMHAEQVRMLYDNLPLGVSAGLLNAIILAFVQINVIPRHVLVSWLAAMGLISLGRYGLYLIYRHANPPPSETARWEWLFAIGVFLSGTTWGSAGLLLFPEVISHQVFVIFVLAGMTAGAVASFSSQLWVSTLFTIPCLLPLTARLFVEGHDVHLAMGLMSLLFMWVMLVTARRIYTMTLTSLRLRFENDDLIAYLEREKQATENLNQELQHEIQRRARIESGLRESETRVRALVDNVPDGIITISEDGILESLNPAAERIFGYAAEEMIGLHFKMLVPPGERDGYDDYIAGIRGQRPGRAVGFGLEITGLRKDGSVFPMELAISRMQMEKRSVFIGIVRDISERQEIDRLKNQFVAAVSHELRTPLTSVLGSLSLLGEGVAGELSERGQSLLNIARTNMERLVRLVGDILDVDDIRSGKLRLDRRRMELAPLVAQALQQHEAQAQRRAVDLQLRIDAPDLYVYADAERLRHVLGHLLSNAIKFSPRDGRVDIRVERHGGQARVSVQDRGAGVPEGFREQMFELFAQADFIEHNHRGGTGLGLNIARAIIERHGGRIDFDSRPGEGTCFYFELPEWQD